MIEYLKNNKRFWVPPIVVFLAILIWVAWKAANAPGSPFEYELH